MCGIAGIVSLDGAPIRVRDLTAMAELLSHRGPDGEGIALLSENPSDCRFFPTTNPSPLNAHHHAGFAHKRLSIIDLTESGIQPMRTTDGRLWVTYNGELYNYIELRHELEERGRRFSTKTDTEVLLAAYDEWGTECMDRFNGMWAFALWDMGRRTLFIARDRFGIKPLYYVWKAGKFAFASEPKALLALDWVSNTPDDRAIADYLVHSRVDCFSWTFFRDIRRLEPGCFFEIPFGAGSLPEPRRWWNLASAIEEPPQSDGECRERFIDLLTSSVQLRLRSDVPVGTCLSGGLDSSAVVCIARPWLEKGNQKTYSAVYDPSFAEDESRFIDEIARFIDVENYRVNPTAETLLEDMDAMITSQGEPFGSTSQYAQYRVFQTARAHGTTVTLDGQGADEELAGYHYLFPVHVASLAHHGKPLRAWRELSAYRGNTGAPFADSLLSTLAGFFSHRTMIRLANLYDPGRTVNWVNRDISRLAGTIRAPKQPGIGDRLNKRLYELFTVSSLPALLRYEDRNSMAWAVEARLPFMDYRLVSFLFSLPSEQKIRNGLTKYVMREALRGIVPESIRARTDKVGFSTPEADWYRNFLVLGFMRTILNDAITRKRGLYDCDRLSSLIEANAAGVVDAGRAIWRALNLELWFRRYVD